MPAAWDFDSLFDIHSIWQSGPVGKPSVNTTGEYRPAQFSLGIDLDSQSVSFPGTILYEQNSTYEELTPPPVLSASKPKNIISLPRNIFLGIDETAWSPTGFSAPMILGLSGTSSDDSASSNGPVTPSDEMGAPSRISQVIVPDWAKYPDFPQFTGHMDKVANLIQEHTLSPSPNIVSSPSTPTRRRARSSPLILRCGVPDMGMALMSRRPPKKHGEESPRPLKPAIVVSPHKRSATGPNLSRPPNFTIAKEMTQRLKKRKLGDIEEERVGHKRRCSRAKEDETSDAFLQKFWDDLESLQKDWPWIRPFLDTYIDQGFATLEQPECTAR